MRDDWGFPNGATPPGSSSYYSLRLAPPALRDDLAALHGWRHQVRACLDQVSDPGVAAAKLQWWREELGRILAGTPTHPLGRRLAPLADRLSLPPKPFLDLAWSTEAVLTRHWPRTLDELHACAAQDLGALFELIVRVESGSEPPPGQGARARRLGAYATLVYQIRDSGWLLRQGRLGFIPADRLRPLGLGPEGLGSPAARHHLPSLLAGLARDARRLREDGDDLRGLPATVRIRVRCLDRLLTELEASGFDLADRRIGLTPLRKLWIAWTESRRR
jgi:15-cis-phytoene synthase